MDKLKPRTTPELRFFQGYITAASEMFLRGQLDASLEALAFEILDSSVTVSEVIEAANPDGTNPIQYVNEEPLDQLESEINAFLKVDLRFWKDNTSVPSLIEERLREGFWEYLSQCFDYKNSQIFSVGPDVPCINIGPGFTYVLYNKEMTRCLVLVGNTTD